MNVTFRRGRSLIPACGWGVLFVLFSLFSSAIRAAEPVAPPAVDFGRQIRPILSDKCFACHGPDEEHRKADLRLDERESAVSLAITPGKANESELISRISTDDEDLMMPPRHSNKALTAEEKRLLRAWIDDGAPYARHWSLVPVPTTVAVPEPDNSAGWIRNEIDAFVLEKLQKNQLEPAEAAVRTQWLRRVTFDLTGLPPTLEEIDAFLADQSAKAYEIVVDRLLSSPAYGERMAADWLDAARYADTFGYQSDREMHVWPWRNWVIEAFNKNLPYDKFLLWQIAGDLLEDPTREQRLATTFNRLHRQTNEGGSIEAEFRIEYVADRVRTMGTAILGLTLECARCHDHKYDPIKQREYYQLHAFFNNIDEHGLYSHFTETAPTPALLLYEGDQETRHRELLTQIQKAEQELTEIRVEGIERYRRRSYRAPLKMPEASVRYDFEDLKASGDFQPVPGHAGQAIEFGGDDAYVLKDAPEFSRTGQFSLGLWVRPHQHAPRMVVAHQSRAAEDSAFRGFSLILDQGIPTVSLVHFWPGNALQIRAKESIPLDTWTHLTITYDGSSHAAGLCLYVNGDFVPCDIVRDHLTRDILHRKEWGDSDAGNVKLSLGARFRDVGFKEGAIDDVVIYPVELTSLEAAQLGLSSRPPTQADEAEQYVRRDDKKSLGHLKALQELRIAENELVGQVRQIMTMEEMAGQRPTFVQARGAYDAPTDPVSPGVPEEILPFPDDLPKNRLGFARWLINPDHPLTARVAVNRYWRLFFGQGLVATTEDFGSQGDVPTHPELLDWLARRFVDQKWDVHDLCRTIVLSATYRQASVPQDPALFRTDPANRLLARGPRHRLSAEQLRDNVLAASGLLVRKLGGPSVYPYQPAGMWEEAGTGKHYPQSKGEGLYRRSMYSFWRRTSPPPTMTTFDAPSREFCLARRERTATPMQALTLLNDPQFVEAARVLAERLIMESPDDVATRLTTAFRLLTSRAPTEQELRLLQEFHSAQKGRFSGQQDAAREYVSTGDFSRNDKLDLTDHAATTAVVQLLMSFDECVTKR